MVIRDLTRNHAQQFSVMAVTVQNQKLVEAHLA